MTDALRCHWDRLKQHYLAKHGAVTFVQDDAYRYRYRSVQVIHDKQQSGKKLAKSCNAAFFHYSKVMDRNDMLMDRDKFYGKITEKLNDELLRMHLAAKGSRKINYTHWSSRSDEKQ